MAGNTHLMHDVYETARRYGDRLRLKGYVVDKVIVFGSWAKGTPQKDSDIDICIVSSQFGKDELLELKKLLHETHSIDVRIEPVPMSTADFIQDATPPVTEIKKYGISV